MATAEQQQLTEVLLQEIDETDFPSTAQMDRIERLISTRDELVVYIAMLTQRVEATRYPDQLLLQRLERLLRVLQRFDLENQQEQ